MSLHKIDSYVDTIQTMIAQGRAWVKAHPDASPIVQFNYGKDVMIIGSVELIPETNYVYRDAAGAELIAAMIAGIEEEKTPSIAMLRFAFELMDDPRV